MHRKCDMNCSVQHISQILFLCFGRDFFWEVFFLGRWGGHVVPSCGGRISGHIALDCSWVFSFPYHWAAACCLQRWHIGAGIKWASFYSCESTIGFLPVVLCSVPCVQTAAGYSLLLRNHFFILFLFFFFFFFHQPVPAKSRNSKLSVYVVQYRRAGDTSWTELSTLDNHTLSMAVR